jgi:hypothetical protein
MPSMREQEHEMLVMKGDFPREFLESLGLVKTDVPLFDVKVVGIQVQESKAVSKKLVERMLEQSSKVADQLQLE